MNEGRNREQLLLHRLSAAKSVASQVHEKLHRIRSDLEEADSRIQQLRTQRDNIKSQLAGVTEQCNGKSGRDEQHGIPAKNKTAEFRHAAKATEELCGNRFNLDPFIDKLDPVAETCVKSDGRPSICGLNHALDNFVMNILEEGTKIAAAHIGIAKQHFQRQSVRHPLIFALVQSRLMERGHGLLLDAYIHHLIIDRLYDLFFKSPVAIFEDDDTQVLNNLFDNISKTGLSASASPPASQMM